MTELAFVQDLYLSGLPLLMKETRESFDKLQLSIDKSILRLPEMNKEKNVLPNISFVTLTMGSLILVR